MTAPVSGTPTHVPTHAQRARIITGAFYLSMTANEAADTVRAVIALMPALEQFEQGLADGFSKENLSTLDNLIAALADYESQPGRHLPAARAMAERALAVRQRVV